MRSQTARLFMALSLTALSFTGLSLGLAPLAHAAEDQAPPQVETWSLSRTGALGSAIFIQDRAAWRATDVLLAHLKDRTDHGLIGWIVVEQGDAQLVRFLRGDLAAPLPGYDILVDKNGRPGPAREADEAALPKDQVARFLARTAAAAQVGPLRCAAGYNTVVLPDPDGDGWLVWLLAAATDADKVPLGGHYRFRFSADGRTLEKKEQLSSGCLDLDRRQNGSGDAPVGLGVTVIVAPQPLEIHVFLSLANQLPIYVGAGGKIWTVEGARIQEVPAPDAPPGRRP